MSHGTLSDPERKGPECSHTPIPAGGSLVAAYVGLHGIARQVRNVFNAAIQQQQTEVRFRVAFDGDIGKVRDEMEFIRKEADRLKLSFLDVGDAYSQFVAAIPQGIYTIQEARDIFTGFGTAAREQADNPGCLWTNAGRR